MHEKDSAGQSMELTTTDVAVQRPDDQVGVLVHPDPEDQHLEVVKARPERSL